MSWKKIKDKREKIKELVESFDGLQQVMDLYASFKRKPGEGSGQINGRMFEK